jgi:two-component system chemotaxis response regulator CheY
VKTLIVEDDFVSRRLLQRLLSAYGVCDIAVNGREALDAIALGWEEKVPYDLICLDICMPGMDGQEALKAIRQREATLGIGGLKGVKVIMTTASSDPSQIMQAFNGGCEAYLVKPVERQELVQHLRSLGLLGREPDQPNSTGHQP